MTRRQCILTQIVLHFFPLHSCLLASSVFLNIDDGTWTSDSSEAWEPQTARIIPSSSSWILVLLHTNTTELTWKYTFLLCCPCETLEHVCLCVYMYYSYTQPHVETTPRCAGGQLYHMPSPKAELICPPLLMSTLQVASESCQTH